MTHTCTACHQSIPVGCAVLRGDGHELKAWHGPCFTVVRALSGLPPVHDAALPVGGSLGERLEVARAEARLRERMGA